MISIKKLLTITALVIGTSVAGVAPAVATTSAPAKATTAQHMNYRCYHYGYRYGYRYDRFHHHHRYSYRYCRSYHR